MGWKKPLIIGAISLATLVLAAWLVLWTLDFNRFKPRIIQTVKESSGLELALHGNIEVGLGLGLRLLIHDVAIRNAGWGSRPDMATMRRCELKISLLRLIRGIFEIDRLVFVEPDFLLETDASGMLNVLSFAKDRLKSRPQSEATAQRGPFPSVREVSLQRGRFTYRSGRTGKTYSKRVDRLTLAAPSTRDPVQVAMTGFLNDRPVELEGTLGTPLDLMRAQEPWPVNLTAKGEGAVANIEGAIGDVFRFHDLSLRIQAEGSSVSKILALAGIRMRRDPGPFALTAALTDPGSIPALKDVELRIVAQDALKIRVSGSIGNLASMGGIQLAVTASFKDLSYFSRDPRKPLPAAGPFTVTGTIHDSAPKVLSLHDFRVTGGKDALIGSLDMDWSAKKRRIRLKLSSPGLTLQSFMVSDPRRAMLLRSLLKIGPADLTLSMADPFGRAAVEEIDFRLGKNQETELRIRGRIKDLRAMQGVELNVKAQGKDAADLERVFGKPIFIKGPYTVSGLVTDLSDKGLGCDDFKVSLGKNEVAGLLELHLAGEKPQLNAVLFSQKLDLESAITPGPRNRKILEVLRSLGPIRLAITIVDPGGEPTVPNLNAHMGTKQWAEVSIQGAVKDIRSRRGVDLELAIQGEEFSRLGPLFRRSLPIKGPFSVNARFVDAEPGVYRLEEMKAILGKNDIRGWMEARVQDPLRIEAKFLSQDIDLNVLSPMVGTGAELLRHIRSWSLETRVVPSRDGPLVESFHISLDAPALAEAKLTGSIQDLFTWQGVDVTFSLKGDDVAGFQKIARKPLPFSGPFALTGRLIEPKAGLYKVRNFNAAFGRNDLDGAFQIILTAQKPRITSDLSSRSLDLRPLFSKSELSSETEAERGKGRKPDSKVFSQKPLRLDSLRAIDADIHLQAGQILLPRLALDNATVHLKIEKGLLEIDPLQGTVGGGTAGGRFSLHTEGVTAKAALEFKASEVDLAAMLAELGVEKSVTGLFRAEIEAEARGDSIGALMEGLSGKALFVVADGRIYNKYIDLVGGGLLPELYRLINPFSHKEPFSELTCHVNQFDIQEGVAVSKIWVTDTKYTTVRGAGKIHLGDEKLDMAFRMSPKKSIGIPGLAEIDLNIGDFARSFKVEGTLAQPSVALNPAGAATTIGKMLGGLALFGPIGLAAGLIDLKLGPDHPCLKALEALENGPGTNEKENPDPAAVKRSPASPSQTSAQQEGR
jgi:uncharacterized protein involved in outer membrane biogenesis